jgi:hypothetical protein
MLIRAEFQNDVRVHDRNGSDKTLQGHRPATEEPEEDRKGHTESHWSGFDAQCAQASTGREEEPTVGLLVRVGLYNMAYLWHVHLNVSIAWGVEPPMHIQQKVI